MSDRGFFRNVNDVAFKPRLLRGLLNEQALNAKHPFQSPSELVENFKPIVDKVAVHGLLSESVPDSTDPKLVESWKSAVDAWVDRILKLLASDVSDKSLAGVWLLGLTCRECSTDRFLASYLAWFNELLMHIQSSTSSQRFKLASCASISDLLTRLAGLHTVKDGMVLAGKVIQPTVKLLDDNDAVVVWETAAHLLYTIIHFFPSSVLRHYDNVETVVVSRILTLHSSAKLLKKLACCLALLPKLRGDEDLMLKRVLLLINAHLDDALEGLEEESKRQEAVSILLPPGSNPPPPLGEVSNKVARRSRQLLLHIVSALMQCFCTMLSGFYPHQVTLPVRSVLATIGRVLMADGSVPLSLQPFTTTMQQEVVCAQLPVLHQYSLEVLQAMVNGVDGQLLPYAADIVRLLILYLKKCAFPEQRIQVYSIIRGLLVSMGAGVMLYLAEEVTRNASIDLNSSDCMDRDTSAQPVVQPCNKKRKHGSGTMLSDTQQSTSNLEVEMIKDCSKLIALKIAALQTLEALLRTGGAIRPDGWRPKIDTLVFTTALNACRRGWHYEEKQMESGVTWTNFQIAALDAFLASLLAPARVRPAHLPQGLKLFRDGSQLGGPEIAKTCARAILFLEPLVHPRALPLQDFPYPKINTFSGLGTGLYGSIDLHGPNPRPPFSDGAMGINIADTNNDSLHAIFMEKYEDLQVPVSEPQKTQDDDEKQLQTLQDQNLDAPPAVDDVASSKQALEQEVMVSEPERTGDKMMIDSEENGEPPHEKPGDPDSRQGVTVFPRVSGSSAADRDPGKALLKDHPVAFLDRAEAARFGSGISADTSSISEAGGKNMVLTRADDNTLQLSKDDLDDDGDDDDSSSYSPLGRVELDLDSGDKDSDSDSD